MATITTKQEGPRGCGYRKGGGMYLVCDGPGRGCGRMPVPLHICPTCSHGIKPSRGWTWLASKPILDAAPPCTFTTEMRLVSHVDASYHGGPKDVIVPGPVSSVPGPECELCPMGGAVDTRVGLMWVGGKFYGKPEDFTKEAERMGISKRISQIPKELEVGKTWVWLAHREVFPPVHGKVLDDDVETDEDCPVALDASLTDAECKCGAEPTPGIFHAFKPTHIEYVMKGTETEDELDALEKRGLTIVKVERLGENGELLLDDPNTKDENGDE